MELEKVSNSKLFLLASSQTPVFEENVSNWLTDFYENQKKFSFSNLLQAEILTDFKRLPTHTHIITERSPKTSIQVFSKMHVLLGNLNQQELEVLKYYEQKYLRQPTHLIYLQVTPETALKRIQQRGRESEKTMSLNYLRELEKAYSTWFSTTKKPVYVQNSPLKA